MLLSDDIQMLTLLYERFRRPMYTYMYRLLGNQEDAADTTQEVFLRVCKSWENLRDQENQSEVAIACNRRSRVSLGALRCTINYCILLHEAHRSPLGLFREPRHAVGLENVITAQDSNGMPGVATSHHW